MIGGILTGMAFGIAQGFNSVHQGNKIYKVGKEIQNTYSSLSKNAGKFKESEENTKKTIKFIQGEQNKQADVQFDFNKKQIRTALESNIRNIISNYVSSREDLASEIENAKIKIAFTGDIKNVESSSYKTDMKNKLKVEADEKANKIIQNELNDLTGLESQINAQSYQNKLGYLKTKEGINQNYLSAFSNAEAQYNRDMAQLNSFISAGINQGAIVKAQGGQVMAQGGDMIGQAFLGGMGKLFNAYGGIGGIKNRIFGEDQPNKISYGQEIGNLNINKISYGNEVGNLDYKVYPSKYIDEYKL